MSVQRPAAFTLVMAALLLYACETNEIEVRAQELYFPSGMTSFAVTQNSDCHYYFSHMDTAVYSIRMNDGINAQPATTQFFTAECNPVLKFTPLDTFEIENGSNGDMAQESVRFIFTPQGNIELIK